MLNEEVGQMVFEQQVSGATRDAIAMFSAATEDPNPIHVDDGFAKECGFPRVIQQGPMTTAHFARLLVERLGRQRLKLLDLSFTAPVFPDEALALTAKVAKVEDELTLELTAAKQDGTVTAKGFATVSRTPARRGKS
ncbi:MAG: hypothetical protein A3G80_02220 [Betaproteobacteria bacterium RIFCSPLOWO2_12_FULL_62_13b]|nr:MAG: hypothetical protein A3G80_02220 [Betaproteobacteria bacterium RIFCSPLOWO2_12_FULL_62_13b]